ncbi:PilZ domain-containing protein [bacterium]|nr:PilZ domain-containing protein [bacterium]
MAAVMSRTPRARRKTRRKSVRTEVSSHEVKGVLTRGKDRAHAPFLIWDISEDGIGIWLPLELNEGEDIVLNLGKPKPMTAKGRVMWCNMRPGKLGYHAGILVEEGKNRLLSVYRHLLEIETFAFEQKMASALKDFKAKK